MIQTKFTPLHYVEDIFFFFFGTGKDLWTITMYSNTLDIHSNIPWSNSAQLPRPFWFVETGSHYVAQADLELTVQPRRPQTQRTAPASDF